MTRIASGSASSPEIDTSYRRAERMPEDAVFAGSYRFSIIVDWMTCSLFFRTVDGVDELWAWGDWQAVDRPELCSHHGAFGIRRKAAAPARPEIDPAVRATDLLIAACEAGNEWFPDIDRGPLLDVARIDRARDRNARRRRAVGSASRRRMSPMIGAALELGLNPAPTGTQLGNWVARCPETNHTLMLTETQWSCGWCRRKGGEDELRAFAVERREGRRLREEIPAEGG